MDSYHSIAPLKIKRKGKHESLPPEIMAWIRERDRLLKQTRRFPNDDQIKNDFRNIRNFVNSLLRDYRSQKYRKMTSKITKESKSTWKFLNQLLGRVKHNNDCEVTSDELNNYFTEPKPWSVIDHSPCTDCDSDIEPCSLRPLSVDHLFKCLSRLSVTRPMGLI